ncbi:DUF6894 family protein [Lichenifustis flavocetrariae]|uniref:DUF6894 domain-containing protein n=1 Tax=Lichenifustis flavocetrariae TaxID=2949735 RepID=A0AA41Z0U6_9HYPH|nr:hypothetical protein [Lichenifustis flavocetrariae]MCW6510867.1 hypothetical protein [Lichenifustis flavocetrariae]
MPRYFFNVKKDNRPPDTVGVELASAVEARLEAVRTMGEDLKDNPSAFWDDEEWQISVSDERGLVLFTL